MEELTGQTDDFANRLRRFKEFVSMVKAASEASVRDRYAVRYDHNGSGIDIGSLQSVSRANMPPRRFNYRERVRRARTHRQAYSLGYFCRRRSHDAYISLTRGPSLVIHRRRHSGRDSDPLPLRLLRKVSLRAAFRVLREEFAATGRLFPTTADSARCARRVCADERLLLRSGCVIVSKDAHRP